MKQQLGTSVILMPKNLGLPKNSFVRVGQYSQIFTPVIYHMEYLPKAWSYSEQHSYIGLIICAFDITPTTLDSLEENLTPKISYVLFIIFFLIFVIFFSGNPGKQHHYGRSIRQTLVTTAYQVWSITGSQSPLSQDSGFGMMTLWCIVTLYNNMMMMFETFC